MAEGWWVKDSGSALEICCLELTLRIVQSSLKSFQLWRLVDAVRCVCYKIVKSENALPSLKQALWKDCFQMLRTIDKGWLRRCKMLIDSAQRLQIAFCAEKRSRFDRLHFVEREKKQIWQKGSTNPLCCLLTICQWWRYRDMDVKTVRIMWYNNDGQRGWWWW